MDTIADKYEDGVIKARYKRAVKKFRWPYWDYYRPRAQDVVFPGVGPAGFASFPYVFTDPSVAASYV